jgi:GTPase SAR1 family protein
MDLNEYNTKSRVKLLVYGPPKSGKTALVGKLAEHYKLHWIDLENGIKTLLNPAMLKPEFRKNVNVINVPDTRFLPTGITTVLDIFRGGAKRICYDHGKNNCPLCAKRPEARWSEIDLSKFGDEDILVIDSLSQLSSSALNKVTLAAITKPGGEEYKASWDDYSAQGALINQLLSIIQALDIHVAVISHEVDVEKDEKKEKLAPVSGTRNASKLSAKYFDEVVYCAVVNRKHRAFNSSVYDPTVATGGRYGVKLDDQKDDEISLLPLFKRA